MLELTALQLPDSGSVKQALVLCYAASPRHGSGMHYAYTPVRG